MVQFLMVLYPSSMFVEGTFKWQKSVVNNGACRGVSVCEPY
jgi:hypothetical protein